MESQEGPPVEGREGEEHVSEEENLQESGFRNSQDFLNFLDRFNKLRDNEYRQQETDEDLNLPATNAIRLKTIENLRKLREEEYNVLSNKYSTDELEVRKIISNRDKYTAYESKNEDVRVFIELSKNISQLEKGIFTKDNIEAMYIFGDEEEPRAKKLREKLKKFFKEHKNMFFLGAFVIAFSSVIVSIEEVIVKLKEKVKKEMYKKFLQVKDDIKNKIDETKKNVR